MEFIDVFSFILTHIMLGLLSPASAKADVFSFILTHIMLGLLSPASAKADVG